jgi:hypothetical protein
MRLRSKRFHKSDRLAHRSFADRDRGFAFCSASVAINGSGLTCA